jgi:hypothetical protein
MNPFARVMQAKVKREGCLSGAFMRLKREKQVPSTDYGQYFANRLAETQFKRDKLAGIAIILRLQRNLSHEQGQGS